jgi:hypothetical protein
VFPGNPQFKSLFDSFRGTLINQHTLLHASIAAYHQAVTALREHFLQEKTYTIQSMEVFFNTLQQLDIERYDRTCNLVRHSSCVVDGLEPGCVTG